MRSKFIFFVFFFLTLTLAQTIHAEESDYPESAAERRRKGFGSVLGEDKDGGVTVFGKSMSGSKENKGDAKSTTSWWSRNKTDDAKSTKTVAQSNNNCLWQAALDSVQFMPILVSDSSGGVLSTDWYEDADLPNERYKFNILIKSNKIQPSSLHVSAFKQTLKEGRWKDVKVSSAVASEMKNKILSKAKQLNQK